MKPNPKLNTRRETGPRAIRFASSLAGLVLASAAHAQNVDIDLVESLHLNYVEHVTQAQLNTMQLTDPLATFLFAFDVGDGMFEADFTLVDGGGANVGNGERTTRIPRADLDGPGEWANHTPPRATGPNATSCVSCHFQPVADGAGGTAADVHRDPLHSGDISQMIHRNTPHLHGMGAIQRLAEEMTEDLHALRDAAVVRAQSGRTRGQTFVKLQTKGVQFGSITLSSASSGSSRGSQKNSARKKGNTDLKRRSSMARPMRDQDPSGPSPTGIEIDYSKLEGIDEDLVVKPFQWKGTFPSVRSFNLDAMHNELGVQPREIVADGVDGDGDGYDTEATVGDMTALALYMAAQPRPTTNVELGENGFGPVVSAEEIAKINAGSAVFEAIGCAKCHMPSLTINLPVFSEPSTNPNYRDETFLGGQNPVALGLDPANPITFDLTTDIPDNKVLDATGAILRHVGALESNTSGGAIVRAYGDLKRHDMGPAMAESIDEAGTGASVFLTENLWGVGVTAPYMHDGRATTLTEAILWHGGEAAASVRAFKGSPHSDQAALVSFLEDLVIFLPAE